MYYRNAQAALVVYDLTKPTSLIKAKHWVAELQRQASPGIVIALCGNKLDLAEEDGSDSIATPSDLDDENENEDDDSNAEAVEPAGAAGARKISNREAKAYAEEEGLLFFETSAKTGANVSEVFTAIANAIPETSLKGPRGAAGAGSTAIGAGAAGGRGDESRVSLTERGRAGAKEGCAC